MTPPSVTGVPGTTGHYNCTQGWTSAMSVTTSAITGDELETISDLRRRYEFCDDEMIVSIRCADLISEKTAEELGQKVTCDMTQGLICKGADQAGGKCADYTVQLYCDCEASCSPACQNGGSCLLPNTCGCSNGFMGAQCQYPANNCASPPTPQNAQVTCQQDSSGARCTVACNQGYKPLWAIAPSFTCSPDGTWSPDLAEIPGCVDAI
ncbi:MUC5B-like protein [Mya arenaria]|uniref:MUC5B-like protein n=1 Tax=Mya arenaria TaxID=6604 RepID=A0ABY7ELG3_MYAAR|nr:MUC5B-like protein [Mya arenaria]